ncbi:MAG: hypothetical protein L3K09_04615 [Thermoplasmata archaeon]|nr:hypothetical protein [Thermoplasmata archaeon]
MSARIPDQGLAARIEDRLAIWQASSFAPRLWAKDPTLWSATPMPEVTDRLGWLDLPMSMASEVGSLSGFAAELRDSGVQDVVVLGMGGSSLAPTVFARVFGSSERFPRLTVLDTTHPDAIGEVRRRLDLAHAAFVVSSKSGTTTETLSLFAYFWKEIESEGAAAPGAQFVAITDPGTPLAELARKRGFRKLFEANPNVGGRYSALTHFGLVPAAMIGVDVDRLLGCARAMAARCGAGVKAAENPGLELGALLGEAGVSGRDKVTFLTSPPLSGFPVWIEQLIAESTGKDGKGLVPVAGEPLRPPPTFGVDRVTIGYSGPEGKKVPPTPRGPTDAAPPGWSEELSDVYELGGEFFRWEVAVASAGAILGIHPFNQPDVQLAKDLARREIASPAASPSAGASAPATMTPGDLATALGAFFSGTRPGEYLGIHAYLAPDAATDSALSQLRIDLSERTRLPVTLGYGPRFLHSTGQLHKGGPPTGRFLQFVDTPRQDLPIPGEAFTFGQLIAAQSRGDKEALSQRGRTVLTLPLGGEPLRAIGGVGAAVRGAARQPGGRR